MTHRRGWAEQPASLAAAMPYPSTQNLYVAVAGLPFVALLLISCSGAAQQTAAPGDLSVSYTGALSVENQLAAGSLLLEETDMAIDSAQANELLVLWQAYRSLSKSDTAAQAEIDAVITQIEDTMTTDQLEAIRAMQLTADDLASVLQEHAAASMASAGSSSGTGLSTDFGPDAGGFVVGSGPGPGGADGMAFLAPASGQGTILSAASTEIPQQNLTTSSPSSDRAAIRLVDSLITLLETKGDT